MECQWISNCPYYEVQTSYGTETVKCGNTDCILHDIHESEGKA